jgi:hypothetical protein
VSINLLLPLRKYQAKGQKLSPRGSVQIYNYFHKMSEYGENDNEARPNIYQKLLFLLSASVLSCEIKFLKL